MTDTKSFADKVRGQATGDSPQVHRVPERRRWTDTMMHSLPALSCLRSRSRGRSLPESRMQGEDDE